MNRDLAPIDYYPPQMLVALAAKLDDPYTVAATYGYPASEYDRIKDTPAFKAALAKAEESLQGSGLDIDTAGYSLLQEMSQSIAQNLYTTYHHHATPVETKVKIAATLFAREAQLRERVKPKAQNQQGNGGFQIIFNIPQLSDSKKEPIVIEAC